MSTPSVCMTRSTSGITPTHLTRYLRLLMPKEGLTDAVRRAIDQIEMERSPESGSVADAAEMAPQSEGLK